MRVTWIVILALVAAAAGAFAVRERLYALVGPADLGPVVFETLQRRNSPNDALACPPGLCNARSDVVPPVFAATASDLRVALSRVLAREAHLQLADADDLVPSERYVQRTPLMRFPDTIDVRFIDLPDGRSTLAIYSRSQLGTHDLGANRARIERWLDGLRAQVPAVAVA